MILRKFAVLILCLPSAFFLGACSMVVLPYHGDVASKTDHGSADRRSLGRGPRDSAVFLQEIPAEGNDWHQTYYFSLPISETHTEGKYYRSRVPGKKKAVIVLPIYGSSEIPSASTASHLLDWDTNVVLLADSGDLLEWEFLAQTKTEKEFFDSIKRTRRRFEETLSGIGVILAWLDREPDVDSRRIGIVGFSLGAMVATIAAGADQRISAAALVMAGAGFDEIFLNSRAEFISNVRKNAFLKFALNPDRFSEKIREATRDIEPAYWAKNIHPRQAILFQAVKDSFIPEYSRRELYHALGAPETVIFLHDHKTSFLSTTIAGLNYTPWKIRQFFRKRL